jgi:peptide/nickel transport system permease protein
VLQGARTLPDADTTHGPDVEVPPEREFTVQARSQWKTISKRFLRHRLAMISLFVLIAITLWAFIVPQFWKWEYNLANTAEANQSPSWNHPFGTDDIGQDMFARVMRGTQRSLEVAIIVSILATSIGVVIGAVAGYFRGWVDSLLMRFTDLMLVIPLLVAVAVLGKAVEGNPWYVIPIVLGLFSWPAMARIVRGEFLSLREKEFVEAARAVGASNRRIMFRHILPNLTGPIIVNATLLIAGAILVESALSFLGLGIRPPDSSLGLLINTYRTAFSTRPWLFWFPSVAIVLICLCVNFVGDGLRDAFDPRQNRVRA